MKTPKGLKNLQKKQSKNNHDLDLDKVMVFGSIWSLCDKFGSFEKMEKSPLYQGRVLADNLCREFSKNLTGYSHFSDLYDSGLESEQKRYISDSYNSSSDGDDDSDSIDFDKYNYYEEIKEGFGSSVENSFSNSHKDVLELNSFLEFYNYCVNKKAFSGSKEDFYKALSQSKTFQNYLYSQVTHYTG